MNFTSRRPIVVCLVLIPGLVLACGPYFRSAVFVPSRPVNHEELIDGTLGIVRPSFSRRELFLAYRRLNGKPLDASERAALSATDAAPPAVFLNFLPDDREWLQTRKQVPDVTQDLFLVTTRELKDYSFFLNCTPDAFHTAAAHLAGLIAREGAASNSVRQWLDAQDLVFQNCSKDAPIPSAPTPEMTPAQRADRLYQVAAAHFYATRYDLAAEEFRAIAQDDASPWQNLGLFLAARCYLRKATVGPLLGTPHPASADNAPPPLDRESMRQALALLQQVAANKSLARVHDSALRLVSFAELHLEPAQQARKLSAALSGPTTDPQFATHLDDYLHLLGTKVEPGDELGEWITAVQQPAPSCIARWRSNPRSQAWLVAALLAAGGKSEDAPALVAAALKVDTNSPAYFTAQYHAARMRYERGEFEQVRQQIDALLKAQGKQLNVSSLAAFRILRSRAAASLTDFAPFAALTPTGFEIPEEPNQMDPCLSATGEDARACSIAMITPAAAAMINHMPLSAQVQLASLDVAPLPLRRGAALVAFERGVLLGDFKQADAAAHLLSAMNKLDASDLKDYLAAQNDDERRFAAAFVLLHWPGAAPSLNVSFMREEAMRKLSNFRNNWWGRAQGPSTQSSNPLEYLAADEAPPQFLSEAERLAGAHEYAALAETGSASIGLPRVVLEWAKAHHDDPRVPEALHLAIDVTHYGSDTAGASPAIRRNQ